MLIRQGLEYVLVKYGSVAVRCISGQAASPLGE